MPKTNLLTIYLQIFMKNFFTNSIYIITCLGVIIFSFYITNLMKKQKEIIKEKESQITNLKIENYELNEIIKASALFNIETNDSILHKCFTNQIKNTLVIRLTEEICMNCYLKVLKQAIETYETNKQFNLIILGKYRFDANLRNDLKDIIPSNIEKINSPTNLFLDNLCAPYFLFFNKEGKLSHLYILPKNNPINFKELYSRFN